MSKAFASVFVIAVIVFSVGFLVATVQQLQKKITFRSDAANETNICPVSTPPKFFAKAEQVTDELVVKRLGSFNHAFSKAEKNNNAADQLSFIKKRKAYLLETMNRNPKDALKQIISQKKRDSLSPVIQQCVETTQTRTGKLEIRHTDYNRPTNHNTDYVLLTPEKKRLQLHPTNEEKFQATSGDTISVTGYQIDNDMLINTDERKSLKIEKSAQNGLIQKVMADIPDAIGSQRTVAVMFNYQNAPSDPFVTKERVTDLVFNQASKYFHEVSYGKTTLTGQVIDKVSLPIPQSCDFYTLEDEIIKAIDSSVDFRNVDRLLLIGPIPYECGFAGISTLGKISKTTADGDVMLSISDAIDYYLEPQTTRATHLIEHELGHGFGIHHANFLFCGNQTFDTYDPDNSCDYEEYGDIYDVMGYSLYGHYNSPHKKALGWYNPGNIQTITKDGVYTLEPLETTTNNLKAIQLQRDQSLYYSNNDIYTDFLTVEFRQPIGYDSYLGTDYNTLVYGNNVLQGALMYVGYNSYPFLIDTTPPGQPSTPALLPGQSITDPQTGSKITLTKVLKTGITLDVKVGKKDFSTPTLSILAPQDGITVNGTVTLSVTALAPSGISKIVVDNNTFNPSKTVATLTAPPYTIQIDTRKFNNGINYLTITAYDTAGIAYNAANNSNSQYVTFDVQNPDSTPPSSIIVTNPGTNAQVKNPVQVSAQAVDELGIAYVEYYLDNDQNFYDSEQDPPYSIPQDLLRYYRIPAGQHAIYAKAYDYSGNVKISNPIPFTVIADTTKPVISMTSPKSGNVQGIFPVSATASDDSMIDYVNFYMDNDLSLLFDTRAPYSTFFDSSAWGGSNSHTFYATAYDLDGNSTTSDPVTVVFANPTPTQSPISAPSVTLTLRWGDANDDGTVNVQDVFAVFSNWLKNLTTSIDQYGDGRINALDFVRVIKNL